MTKDRFIKELGTLSPSVESVRNVGYTDDNGLWEMMRLSRYKKCD